jgi:hypothetical protein
MVNITELLTDKVPFLLGVVVQISRRHRQEQRTNLLDKMPELQRLRLPKLNFVRFRGVQDMNRVFIPVHQVVSVSQVF